MRLKLMAPPDVAHRRFADPQLVGQAAAAPLALPLGFGLQGSVDDLLDFLRPIASFASPPRGHLPETWQTLLGKASAPESHGRASALQLLCDGVIGLALGSCQHDTTAQGYLLGRAIGRSPLLQLLFVTVAEP